LALKDEVMCLEKAGIKIIQIGEAAFREKKCLLKKGNKRIILTGR
jgi:methionine synthase II (cobalamin-independent)